MTDYIDGECVVDECGEPNRKWSIYCPNHYKEMKQDD